MKTKVGNGDERIAARCAPLSGSKRSLLPLKSEHIFLKKIFIERFKKIKVNRARERSGMEKEGWRRRDLEI